MTRFTAPVNAPILRADQYHHKGSPAFDQSHHCPQPQTLEQFQAHIEHEFVIGSAIAPTLFAATIHIVSDTETIAGGEARYPIDEAFNWQPIRFGQQARATQYAALFTNEDGSVWQGKLSQPRIDKEKTKKKLKQASGKPAINSFEFWSLVKSHPEAVVYQKYETPIGKALFKTVPHALPFTYPPSRSPFAAALPVVMASLTPRFSPLAPPESKASR